MTLFMKEPIVFYLAGSRAQLEKDGFDYETKNQIRSYLIKNCPEVEIACSIWPARAEYCGVRYEKGDEFLLPEIDADTSLFPCSLRYWRETLLCAWTTRKYAITDKAAKRIFGKRISVRQRIDIYQKKG